MERLKFLLILLICLIVQYSVYSQVLDTMKVIHDIRKKFVLIHNNEIDGMKVYYQTPSENTADESEEIFDGSGYNFTLFYSDSTIYMIREYSKYEEGGPLSLSSSLTETYLFQNKPFFYYQKDFCGSHLDEKTGIPVYALHETRKYIHNRKIIKMLSKYILTDDSDFLYESDLLNVKTDSVPNIEQKIRKQNDEFLWNEDDINKYLKIIEDENNKGWETTGNKK